MSTTPTTTTTKNKTRTKDKYRVVYTDTQRIELENEFRLNEYIAIPRKQEIAQKLQLSERQIKIWFQNRRAKKRKQQKRKQLAAVTTTTNNPPTGHLNNNNDHNRHLIQQQSFNRSSSDELTRSSISDISFQHQYPPEGHHHLQNHHLQNHHHPHSHQQSISDCAQQVLGYPNHDQHVTDSTSNKSSNRNSTFNLAHQQHQDNLKTTSNGSSPTSSSVFAISATNSAATGCGGGSSNTGNNANDRNNNNNGNNFNEISSKNNELTNDAGEASRPSAAGNESSSSASKQSPGTMPCSRLTTAQQPQLHHNQPINQVGTSSPTSSTAPAHVVKRDSGPPSPLQTGAKLDQDGVPTSPNSITQHQPAHQIYQQHLGRAQAVTAAAVAQHLASGVTSNFYDPIYMDQTVQQPAAYYAHNQVAGPQQHHTSHQHPQPQHPHPHSHPHHHHHHHNHNHNHHHTTNGDSAMFHHQNHNLRQHQLMASPISATQTAIGGNQTASNQLSESCWPHEPASANMAASAAQASLPPAGIPQATISNHTPSCSTSSSSQSTSPAMLTQNANNNQQNYQQHQYHNNHHQFHLSSLPHFAAARAQQAAAAVSAGSLPISSSYVSTPAGHHHQVANGAPTSANYSIANGYHPINHTHPQHTHQHPHNHHNNSHPHHQFMIEQHYANSVVSASSTGVTFEGDQHLTQSQAASARSTCSPNEQNHHLIGPIENSYYHNKVTLEANAMHRGGNPLIGKHAIYH